MVPDGLWAVVHDWFVASLPAHGLALLIGVALVAGLARGFSGFGAALIFIPLGGAIIGPKMISPVLLLIDGLATLGMVRPAIKLADRGEVTTMAAGALIGVPLGTAALALLDPLLLRWVITGIAACLLALLMSGWRYHGQPGRALTTGVGLIAGLFSGAAQTGGPPVVAFWLSGKSSFTRTRANIILYFSISTVFSFVSYYLGGLLVAEVFALTVLILPSYSLGLYTGARLFGLAREGTFRAICFVLIGSSAVLGMPALDGWLR